MQHLDGVPTLEQHAQAVLARRREAAQLLEAAERSGEKKETRQWKAAVRQWDKLIAEYGLDRYA